MSGTRSSNRDNRIAHIVDCGLLSESSVNTGKQERIGDRCSLCGYKVIPHACSPTSHTSARQAHLRNATSATWRSTTPRSRTPCWWNKASLSFRQSHAYFTTLASSSMLPRLWLPSSSLKVNAYKCHVTAWLPAWMGRHAWTVVAELDGSLQPAATS